MIYKYSVANDLLQQYSHDC